MSRKLALVVMAAGVWACSSEDGAEPDASASVDAATVLDASPPDAQALDAGRVDAAPPPVDSGPPPCNDPLDFGSRDSPRNLPTITDKEDFHTRAEVLEGPGDVDRFRFYSDDLSSGLFPSPYAEVKVGSVAMKVCTYLRCTSGSFTTTPECPSGTQAATDSQDGDVGCCYTSTSSAQTVKISYDCATTDDDVTMTIDVSSAEAMCSPYTLQYRTGD